MTDGRRYIPMATDDTLLVIDDIRATAQRILMTAYADVTVEKMPVNRAEAEYLREQAGDEWFDAHCVEYGPLPSCAGNIYITDDTDAPMSGKPGPGAKWGERRAFLEGKKR